MTKNKTVETSAGVPDFVNAVTGEQERKDCFRLIEVIKEQTGFDPKMWGPAIIGFGSCHYRYASGREGEMPLTAFSPRKTAFALYLSAAFEGRAELLQQFGKYKSEKGCIYFKRLSDINVEILKEMVAASVKHYQNLYP